MDLEYGEFGNGNGLMVEGKVVLACGLVRVYPCCTGFPRLLAE